MEPMMSILPIVMQMKNVNVENAIKIVKNALDLLLINALIV